MLIRNHRLAIAAGFLMCVVAASALPQDAPAKLSVDWTKVTALSKTTVSIQDCPEPPLWRGSPAHDGIYKALLDLHADYPRLQPWFTYPRVTVAELKPAENGKTYWDFSLMDQMAEDFIIATGDHPVVFDFGTLPEWMFKTKSPVAYAEDPNQIDWDYEQGTELRDPTMKEVADYQARLVGWYTKGGFKDEYGKWHASGHHYNIAYWEILNEVDSEHKMSPEFYTRLYDAVVEQVRIISPRMKFIGLALADPLHGPDYFTYFLDPKHHKPGIPIDMISYHYYYTQDSDETPETMQYTIFDGADTFLTAVRYIESIRKRFSPHTGTYIDELGVIVPDATAPKLAHPIPDSYWNLAAGMWAYLYGQLAEIGIDIAGGAELVDYPGMFPGTNLVSWDTGQPNARYWGLKLLRDNFGPGDKLVATKLESPQVYAQAFLTPEGRHKILLVNKRDRTCVLTIPGAEGGQLQQVDQSTASSPPVTSDLRQDELTLAGLAVAVVTVPTR
ncbi:MAG TPA: glycosyl hydrolase family 39 [Terriglobia bacterium]|nr:glycosyl hydrolase family 39 [Terriglobia bacterium]